MTDDKLLTTKDLVARTGFGMSTIRRLLRNGDIRSSKPGGKSYRVRESDYKTWVAGLFPDDPIEEEKDHG
jgi:excisionase family DNA binding protein